MGRSDYSNCSDNVGKKKNAKKPKNLKNDELFKSYRVNDSSQLIFPTEKNS